MTCPNIRRCPWRERRGALPINRLIFSRKGFDSGSGGGSSPIVNGRPISLPIPARTTNDASRTRYRDIGLADHVRDGAAWCHHDPFFSDCGRVAFGQHGAAQSHLAKHGVGAGDVFLFFGWFRGGARDDHHRIFGYMRVEAVLDVTSGDAPPDFAPDHPHFLNRDWPANVVYSGSGTTARRASDMLRLSVSGARRSLWQVPGWLHHRRDLSYHTNPARWLPGDQLQTVARGQEFVVDIADDTAAQHWAAAIIAEIESDEGER